jgi:hypothetical protein
MGSSVRYLICEVQKLKVGELVEAEIIVDSGKGEIVAGNKAGEYLAWWESLAPGVGPGMVSDIISDAAMVGIVSMDELTVVVFDRGEGFDSQIDGIVFGCNKVGDSVEGALFFFSGGDGSFKPCG